MENQFAQTSAAIRLRFRHRLSRALCVDEQTSQPTNHVGDGVLRKCHAGRSLLERRRQIRCVDERRWFLLVTGLESGQTAVVRPRKARIIISETRPSLYHRGTVADEGTSLAISSRFLAIMPSGCADLRRKAGLAVDRTVARSLSCRWSCCLRNAGSWSGKD